MNVQTARMGDSGVPAGLRECGLPPKSVPKNYLMAWLLVVLKDLNLHGYEIMRTLKDNFAVVSDPGTVYRALRQLERDGYITSWWASKEQSPARRVYTLTDAGLNTTFNFTNVVTGPDGFTIDAAGEALGPFADLVGRAMGREHMGLVRHIEVVKRLHAVTHRFPIRFAPHDHGHQRFRFRHGVIV